MLNLKHHPEGQLQEAGWGHCFDAGMHLTFSAENKDGKNSEQTSLLVFTLTVADQEQDRFSLLGLANHCEW